MNIEKNLKNAEEIMNSNKTYFEKRASGCSACAEDIERMYLVLEVLYNQNKEIINYLENKK